MATLRATFIRQGSNPALEVTAKGIRIASATIYVTIQQDDCKLTKSNYQNATDVTAENSGDDTIITVNLAQEDTLYLRPGNGTIQVRWIYEDGTAGITDIGRIEIGEALLKGVIAYG